MTPEQQDGLAEPRGAERSDLARAAGALDELDELCGGHATLLGGRPEQVGRARRALDARPVAIELDGDRRPALEQRRGRCIGRSAPAAVPIESLEVEPASAQTQDPAPHRAWRHAVLLRDCPDGGAARHHVPGGAEDDLDARHLARQRIPREHPLAVQATATASQRNQQRLKCLRRLEPTRDAASGQLQVRAPAGRAATPGEQVVACVGQKGGVAARFGVEYEYHVLMAAPGVTKPFTGAVISLEHVGAQRTSAASRPARATPVAAAPSGRPTSRRYIELRTRVSTSVVHDSPLLTDFPDEATHGLYSLYAYVRPGSSGDVTCTATCTNSTGTRNDYSTEVSVGTSAQTLTWDGDELTGCYNNDFWRVYCSIGWGAKIYGIKWSEFTP